MMEVLYENYTTINTYTKEHTIQNYNNQKEVNWRPH